MQTLFDPKTHQDVVRRVAALRPDSIRQWGKMSPAQMLEHTSRALEMAIGTNPVRQAFIGKLISWTVRKQFVGEQPFGKNGPTGPWLVVKEEPDFAAVQAKATRLLDEFHQLGERGCDGHVHGFFGKMTGAEWGVTQFKHLDHHLRQFGV
jgi:hypothetical protein